MREQGYSSSLVPFGDSISRIRELENFLLLAMENVDICIELVRIREFDGSGGRIELYPRPYFSVVLISRRAEKSVKEFFRYRFRMKFFRVFYVFRCFNLSRK